MTTLTRMTRLAHSLILVTALLAIAAPTISAQKDQSAPLIAGTWWMTVKGSGAHGDMAASLPLKQDGTQVTGVLNAHGQDRTVAGAFVGGNLTLQTRDGEPAQQLALKASLKADGTLAGYISGEMGDMRWTATRIKA
ncbi:hypothetical protein BH18ACI5_BH18ACI5_17500 [soil metagenome]